MVSDDWVVRYKNRLLQLQRETRHWAPAKSRVVVRENEAGAIAIHYRGRLLPFREIQAPAERSRERGAPLPPHLHPRALRDGTRTLHPGRTRGDAVIST